ncbi:MAG: hypothetical protein QM758_07810 [Armatimonas sp.]
MSFEKRLQRLARRLSTPSLLPPVDLRTRVLSALPERPNQSGGISRIVRPVLLTAAALSVATASLFLIPRFRKPGMSSTSVSAAVQKTKTWHFTGWRLKGTEKVPWDIWGRRSPFYYREQIGEEILIDDGKVRTHFIPAPTGDPRVFRAIYRPKGSSVSAMVLIQASDSKRVPLIDPSIAYLIGSDGAPPMRQTGQTPVFRVTHTLPDRRNVVDIARLDVDTKTYLPLDYNVKQMSPEGYTALAQLTPKYEVNLPADSLQPSWPANTPKIDLREPCTAPEAKGDHTYSQAGWTVSAAPLARDTEGTVRLRLQTWLGNTLSDSRSLPITVGLSFTEDIKAILATDDRGASYVYLPVGYNGSRDLYLTPLEPPAPNTPAPTRLHITLPMSATRHEFVQIGPRGFSLRPTPILQQRVTLTVTLPQKTAPLYSVEDFKDPATRATWSTSYPFQLALARAMGYYYVQEKPEQEKIARQIYWYTRTADAAQNSPGRRDQAEVYRRSADDLRKRLTPAH